MAEAKKGAISSSGDKFLAMFLMWRLKNEEMYGYILLDEIQGLGINSCKQSSLYSILSKLEKKGLVSRKNKLVGNRARKVYRTTPEGKKLLERIKKTRIQGKLREFLAELISN